MSQGQGGRKVGTGEGRWGKEESREEGCVWRKREEIGESLRKERGNNEEKEWGEENRSG